MLQQRRNRASWASVGSVTNISSFKAKSETDLTCTVQSDQSKTTKGLQNNCQSNQDVNTQVQSNLANCESTERTESGSRQAASGTTDRISGRQSLPWSGITRNVREQFENVHNNNNCSASQRLSLSKPDTRHQV